MNEKRSLIESEGIYLSNSCEIVCSHCDELKNVRYGYYGDSYLENPFVLISKTSFLIGYNLFSVLFVFSDCLKESGKGNVLSMLGVFR